MSSTPIHPLGGFRPEHTPPVVRYRFSIRTKLWHLAKRIGWGAEVAASRVLPLLPKTRKVIAQAQVGSRTVRCYKHWPLGATVLGEWDALAKSTPGATVFQAPSWQQAAAIVPDGLGTLRLMTVHDGDRLVAAVALERRWGGHWRTNGYITTAFHDPLIDPASAQQTWDALLRGIAQMDRNFKSLTLELVSPEAACLTDLPPVASAAGFTVESEELTVKDTGIELVPTWDGYLAKLDGHHRRELRRRMRKLEDTGKTRFVINDTPEAVAQALPGILDLMEQDGGGKGRKTKWLFRRHLNIAAPPLAQDGRLVVYQLFIEDKLAAGVIALVQGNHQLMWNCAMNAEFYKDSPGIVLWGMIIRKACELGQSSLDLLRGLSTYKYQLGATERPLHRVTITRNA